MISTALQSPIVANGANGSNGTAIGRYHLVAELAKGGMGNIYLAVMRGPAGFNKLLVVKELKPELARDEMYVGMFLDEARLAARMSHPNIVQTNEVGSDGSRHYMVMEFLDGRSLHRIGKRLGGRFPVAAHLRVIAESLLGLHHAHEMRDFDGEPLDIVHRDVSPLNVFITFAGQAKVLDFGIAKALDSTQETKMGVLKGRIAYMAPEQARGDKVDRRADIYSAGVMIWEAVARRRLWPGYAEVEILTELLREGPRPLRSVCPDVPEALDRICQRAMANDRDERYATAADLLHDLEDHLGHRADAMSIRDVGALVSRAFAHDREKMSAVIEEALTRLGGAPRSGTRSKVMPRFRAPVSESPTSTKVSSQDFAEPNLPGATSPRTISPGAVSSFGSLSRPALATNATLGSARSRKFITLSSKHLGIAAAGAAALLMGIVFGGRLAVRDRGTVASPTAAPAQVVPVATHNDVELVDLVVRVTPSFAQITIDGASLVNNPFHARYPKDNRMHHIVVAADGYESRMEDVTFATDVSIDVSLSRRANASQPQSGSVSSASPARVPVFRRAAATATSNISAPETASPPPSGSAPGENTGAAGRTPLRPIPNSNPYGSP
jgi:serine/threonine-protein kinase